MEFIIGFIVLCVVILVWRLGVGVLREKRNYDRVDYSPPRRPQATPKDYYDQDERR